MKKLSIVLLILAMSHAVVLAGGLLDGSILSETVGKGDFQIDTQTSYSIASEVINGMNAEWQSLSDANVESITYLYIPVRITHGLWENLSLRVTLPYASLNGKLANGMTQSGSGLANIEFEGLLNFIEESANTTSFSALVKVKLGTGKKLSELAIDEVYVGSRSTDVMLAGLMGKRLGDFDGKVLLGYLITSPYSENFYGYDMDVDITDQIVYSLGLSYPVNSRFEIAGELWGALSMGSENWSILGYNTTVPQSNRDSVIFSPGVTYTVNDDFVLRGNADIVLSKSAAMTLSTTDLFKYNTYTVGGTWGM